MNYIITSDWHLRSNKPRCRLDDDWLLTQTKALNIISEYAEKYKADVIVIGDIFHSTNETTNEIINLVQRFAVGLIPFNKKLYILAGNHDLPQHNLDNIGRSAFNLLMSSLNIFHLQELKINQYLVSASNFGEDDVTDADIIFKHVLVFPENFNSGLFEKEMKPSILFEQFKNAKYIFTGDYHKQFIYKNGKKRLFNSGCLLRQSADMIDYDPSVFLIQFENEELNYKILPMEDNEKLVTDEYLETERERNDRIEAFIERIKDNTEVTFDFIENVHTMLRNNKIDVETKNTIIKLLEET